jgi:hypothetical protein
MRGARWEFIVVHHIQSTQASHKRTFISTWLAPLTSLASARAFIPFMRGVVCGTLIAGVGDIDSRYLGH